MNEWKVQDRSLRSRKKELKKKKVLGEEADLLVSRIKAEMIAGKNVLDIQNKLITYIKKNLTSKTPGGEPTPYSTSEFKKILDILKEIDAVEVEKAYKSKDKKRTDKVMNKFNELTDAIDNLVSEKQKEATIDYIEKNQDLKTLLTKSKKGKVPPETQKKLKEFFDSEVFEEPLEEKTLEELQEIEKVIKSVIKEGTSDQAAINKAKTY